VACWGAAELMRREFALPITAITGPATDNEVGQVYITTELGLAAHNALRGAAGLVGAVRKAIGNWAEKTETAERAEGHISRGPSALSALSTSLAR
jgi:nicotinamide mononucleotide (NMN) deamidase PncC